MPNRIRPRCEKDDRAMEPLFAKRVRGKSFQRVKEAFWCRECGALAKGRKNPQRIRASARSRPAKQTRIDAPPLAARGA